MRRIALAVVAALLGAGAVVVPGMSAVANAASCHTSPAPDNPLSVESCGTGKSVTYYGPELFGHVKIWEKSNPGNWKNSATDEWWGSSHRVFYSWTAVPWSDATCAAFYWDQNGSYSRYGSIACTPA